jgi:SAM-dependent methyltransferase
VAVAHKNSESPIIPLIAHLRTRFISRILQRLRQLALPIPRATPFDAPLPSAILSQASHEKKDVFMPAPVEATSPSLHFVHDIEQRRARYEDAERSNKKFGLGRAYHRRLAEIYKNLIPPGLNILELGCAKGQLLAALQPARGVGVDFSAEIVQHARQLHPELEFIQGDAHDLKNIQGPFDAIILSDLVNDLWDVQSVLKGVLPLCTPKTRIVINFYSRVWQAPLGIARRLGIARPVPLQNWLSPEDMLNLLYLSGYEPLGRWEEILCPLPIPLFAKFCNKFLVKLWPLSQLAMTNFFMARPTPCLQKQQNEPTVSVIVPARNEAGNIEQIFARTPEMGAGTELIFVEGHSTDDTLATIEKSIADNPHRKASLHRQTGAGKGDAVRLGFEKATGDILMILDADLTVAPEDLPRFFEALRTGRAEFANGVRLVYPMQERAMRPLNFLGNKFFSLAFSWLLGQNIKDTLCGTKVIWRDDYQRLAANRKYFGDFDPFGDFDLLFGAAKLRLKILDLPIRYGQRTYGSTNIQRFRHGWMLLRMVAFAANRIKFV